MSASNVRGRDLPVFPIDTPSIAADTDEMITANNAHNLFDDKWRPDDAPTTLTGRHSAILRQLIDDSGVKRRSFDSGDEGHLSLENAPKFAHLTDNSKLLRAQGFTANLTHMYAPEGERGETMFTDFIIENAFTHTLPTSSSHRSTADVPHVARFDAPLRSIVLFGRHECAVVDRERQMQTHPVVWPFTMRNVWPTRFGLLIERAIQDYEYNSPHADMLTLYTMSHPLDEILPLIIKPKDATSLVHYALNIHTRIVHSDSALSLLLTYDTRTRLHSLWHLREATVDNALEAAHQLETTLNKRANLTEQQNPSPILANSTTSSVTRTSYLSPLVNTTTNNTLSSPIACTPPVNGTAQRRYNLRSTQKRSTHNNSQTISSNVSASGVQNHSPIVTRLLRAIRTDTPANDAQGSMSMPVDRTRASPYQSTPISNAHSKSGRRPIRQTDNLLRNLHISSTSQTSIYPEESNMSALPDYDSFDESDQGEPLLPQVCMHHVWTEVVPSMTRHSTESSTFTTTDLIGDKYLCYKTSANQLTLLKLESDNSGAEETFSVSTVSRIANCTTAANVGDRLLVLDDRSHISVYSGPLMLGTLYLPPSGHRSTSNTPHVQRVTKWAQEILSGSNLLGVDGSDDGAPVEATPSKGVRDEMNETMTLSPVLNDSDSQLCRTINEVDDGDFTGNFSEIVATLPTKGKFAVRVRGALVIAQLGEVCQNVFVRQCLTSLIDVLPNALTVCAHYHAHICKLTNAGRVVTQNNEMSALLTVVQEMCGVKCADDADAMHESVRKLRATPKKGRHGTLTEESPISKRQCRRVLFDEMGDGSVDDEDDADDSDFMALLSSCASTSTDSLINKLLDVKPTPPRFMLTQRVTHAAIVVHALHMAHADMTLHTHAEQLAMTLRQVIVRLAKVYGLEEYTELYARRYPEMTVDDVPEGGHADGKGMIQPINGSQPLVDHMHVLLSLFGSRIVNCPADMHARSVHMLIAMGILLGRLTNMLEIDEFGGRRWRKLCEVEDKWEIDEAGGDTVQRLMSFLHASRPISLSTYPPTIACVFYDAVARYLRPTLNNDEEKATHARHVFVRKMALLPKFMTSTTALKVDVDDTETDESSSSTQVATPPSIEDGMSFLALPFYGQMLRLRFPNDVRVFRHVRNMLDSTRVMRVITPPMPANDDNRAVVQEALLAVCSRQCTQPLGRAAFAYKTTPPVVTSTALLPLLCVKGRLTRPRGQEVKINTSETSLDTFNWALFHNGVAAGLQICDDDGNDGVDSAWIQYHLPSSSDQQLTVAETGFLFGLGLNGYLARLNTYTIHEYLVKRDTFSCVALLLGLAVGKAGTAEQRIMKMLISHIPALLPDTMIDLQIGRTVQSCAILGVGILNACTAMTSVTDVLVREMVRTPYTEMEPCRERDAYALACGMAIGWICLGCGDEMARMSLTSADTRLLRQLTLILNGARRSLLNDEHADTDIDGDWQHRVRPTYEWTRRPKCEEADDDSVNTPLVYEGVSINTAVTTPGASVALALIFLRSNNRRTADTLLSTSITRPGVDLIRPPFFTIRVLCRALVMWDDIVPTKEYVETQVPKCVLEMMPRLSKSPTMEDEVDLESIAQTYCHVVAGACQAIAIRFASTANRDAFKLILHYTRMFLSEKTTALRDHAGAYTMRSCLNTCILSLGVLMAGSGNVNVLALCRRLRARSTSNSATYMCTHLCLGWLFLGGGAHAFSVDTPMAVATLLCSTLAVYPSTLADDRTYVPAWRHLWTMAVTKRCVVPLAPGTGQPIAAKICVKYKDTPDYSNISLTMRAPCIVPSPTHLHSITVDDDRYWPYVILTPGSDTLKLRPHLHYTTGRMSSTDAWPTCDTLESTISTWCEQRQCPAAVNTLMTVVSTLTTQPSVTTMLGYRILWLYSTRTCHMTGGLLHAQFMDNLMVGMRNVMSMGDKSAASAWFGSREIVEVISGAKTKTELMRNLRNLLENKKNGEKLEIDLPSVISFYSAFDK